MGLTKAQLEALNDSSFPNNNAGYITPTILRDYNDAVIVNTVNQDKYTTDSASVDLRLDNLENFSSSLVTNFATCLNMCLKQNNGTKQRDPTRLLHGWRAS